MLQGKTHVPHGYFANEVSRIALTVADKDAAATPTQIAAAMPCCAKLDRQNATAAAPIDWPSNLEVARTPPALPLRDLGALFIMATMLGD